MIGYTRYSYRLDLPPNQDASPHQDYSIFSRESP